MTTRRIGVMGGTFDPIHHGHLVAASEVAYSFKLDTVLFAPTGQPWHKSPAPGATPEERYLMTVLATSQDDRFDVTRVDIDRGGPTYTVDTLRDLQAQYELNYPNLETEWFFITGADALAYIMEWRGPQEVIALAHIIGVTRPGHEMRNPELPADSWTLLEIPAMAISSTNIRTRAGRGEPINYLVPESVANFIGKRKLYQ